MINVKPNKRIAVFPVDSLRPNGKYLGAKADTPNRQRSFRLDVAKSRHRYAIKLNDRRVFHLAYNGKFTRPLRKSTRCREHCAIKILYPVISGGPVFPSFSIPAFQSLSSRFVDVLSVLARITVFRLAGSY